MKRDCRAALLLSAVLPFLLLTLPGNAAQRGISLPAASLTPAGTASFGTVIILPDSGTPILLATFALPPDYAQNTELSFRVYALQQAGACNVVLNPQSITRWRDGFTESLDGPPLDGFAPANNSPVFHLAGGSVVALKKYSVKGAASGTVQGLKPGDIITLRLDREPANILDTCTVSAFIRAAEIRYTVAP